MGKAKVIKGSDKYFREQIKKEWAKHNKELERAWEKGEKQRSRVNLGAGAPKKRVISEQKSLFPKGT